MQRRFWQSQGLQETRVEVEIRRRRVGWGRGNWTTISVYPSTRLVASLRGSKKPFVFAVLSWINNLFVQWRKQLLRIFGPELIRINSLITPRKRGIKNSRGVRFFFNGVSREILKTWHSASEKAFLRGLDDFFGCWIPSWRGILVHKNSLASCQRYCHSVESRTLTCPFKQSNLSAWSLLSWHPTHTYLWGRLCLYKLFSPHCHGHTEWFKLCQQKRFS